MKMDEVASYMQSLPWSVCCYIFVVVDQMQPHTNLQPCVHQRGEQTGLPGYRRTNTVCATVADVVHCNAVHIHIAVS